MGFTTALLDVLVSARTAWVMQVRVVGRLVANGDGAGWCCREWVWGSGIVVFIECEGK